MNESPRWKKAPPGSHWGEFGADDQLGRMNLVDAAKVREGVAEVREGIASQYSTQWDSLAHMGSRFDADDDGKRKSFSTTASAAGARSIRQRRIRMPSRPGRASPTRRPVRWASRTSPATARKGAAC